MDIAKIHDVYAIQDPDIMPSWCFCCGPQYVSVEECSLHLVIWVFIQKETITVRCLYFLNENLEPLI